LSQNLVSIDFSRFCCGSASRRKLRKIAAVGGGDGGGGAFGCYGKNGPSARLRETQPKNFILFGFMTAKYAREGNC
jgi:hypothetical protein